MLPVTSILLMFTAASAASSQQASAQQCKDCKADELSLVQLQSQPILRQNHTLDVADSSTKGNYCIKITTGTSSSNDGTLAVKVMWAGKKTIEFDMVADGADYAKGSTVVEQCYSGEIAAVNLQNPTNNAWTGSVETSTDGGITYAATICGPFPGSSDGSCTTGSDGAHVVVDGNADSANQAQTQCFNGQWCTFKPQQGKYCIKITTGTSSSNDGTLAAKVTFQSSSSSEFQLAVADGDDYAKGSTVLKQCYIEAVLSVDVQNPTTNAWTGSIESSTDGGITYASTICSLVDGGCSAGSDGAQVVVDGNADSANQAPTHCFNGQSCTFKPQQGMEIPAMCSWAMAYQGVSEGTDSCSSGCSDDSCQGVDDCQVQCAQCAECVGFDYCLPGADCGGYRCWLKKQITYVGDYQVAMPTDPAAASDNTWLSYRAGGATSCSVDETCNWAVASEGISEGTDSCPSGCSDDSCQGVDDCVQLCAQCGDCVGFDYCLPGANCAGYRCWLKKQITYNGEYQEAQPTDAAAASGSWLSYSTATTACTADSKRCDTWCSHSKFITSPKFCDWKECGGCTRCQVA